MQMVIMGWYYSNCLNCSNALKYMVIICYNDKYLSSTWSFFHKAIRPIRKEIITGTENTYNCGHISTLLPKVKSKCMKGHSGTNRWCIKVHKRCDHIILQNRQHCQSDDSNSSYALCPRYYVIIYYVHIMSTD